MADVIGRLRGALRSGHPAARLGMLLKALGPITRPADALAHIAAWPPRRTNTTGPALMLVSPPRSGSTVLYQVLCRVIPCMYVSNLHQLFPRSASRWVSQRGPASGSLNNYYGHTSSLLDVNEGNELIGNVFRGTSEPEEIRRRFLRLVWMVRGASDLPVVMKNVGAFDRIAELHQAVPELAFLRIRRDREQIVQSVLRAYRELGGFNAVPAALRSHPVEDPLEFAVMQVREIERTLDEQLSAISSSRRGEVTYEDFCVDPLAEVQRVATTLLGLPEDQLRRDLLPTAMSVSTRRKVSREEASRIRALVGGGS